MEIYTQDFVSIAEEYAEKITIENIQKNSYIQADTCVDLMIKLKSVIHERLCEAFKYVAEQHTGIENSELEQDLYKIINNL
jgi:hypothetical protein